jgi:hypothetical protein
MLIRAIQPRHHSKTSKRYTGTFDEHTVISTEPIIAFLEKTLIRGQWLRVAVIAFGVYYAGSGIAAWFAGTLYSPSLLKPDEYVLDYSALFRLLGFVEPVRQGDFVPFLSDFVHLNFSVLICLVAFPLSYIFVRQIPLELKAYFNCKSPKSDPVQTTEFAKDFQKRLARPVNVVLATFFAVFAVSTFVLLARSRNAEAMRWWGNVQFGCAGYYLAFAQGLCCYYAMWGFELFVILNGFIRDAAMKTDEFHPFHQDGYYGFQPLARLIAWQAVITMLGGLALFSTLYMGYFGLEKMPLIFVSMIVFTIGTAAALAWPLSILTLHVRELRERAVAGFEPRIHKLAIRVGKAEPGLRDEDFRYEFPAMMNLHDAMKSARTLPFGLASLNGVIVGYGAQTAILIRQFYAHFK